MALTRTGMAVNSTAPIWGRMARELALTLQEMLFFSGSVLGPALVAQEVDRVLASVPELSVSKRRSLPGGSVDDLLASVFVEESDRA